MSSAPRSRFPAALRKSIERSLKRLATDHVDLIQLHSCGLDVLKRGDAIKALVAFSVLLTIAMVVLMFSPAKRSTPVQG